MEEFLVTANNRTRRAEKKHVLARFFTVAIRMLCRNVFLEIAVPSLKNNGRSLIQKSGVLVMNSWKMKENFNKTVVGSSRC